MHGPYIGAAPTSLGNAKPKDLGQEILGPQRLLPRIIEFNAIAHPTKLYAIFPKSESFEDGLQELTYKDLANSINRISWWLDEKLGKSGSFDTFAYIGLKDIRYSLLAVAAIKSGRRVLFPSPFGSPEGLESLINTTDCSALLFTPPLSSVPLIEKVSALRPDQKLVPVPSLQEWLDPEPAPEYHYTKTFDQAEHDVFMIIHTSGTTGAPKPLLYTNGCVSAYDAQRYMPEHDGPMWWHLITGKRIFSPMPTLHVAGIFTTLILPIFYDATVVLGPGHKPLTLELVDQIHDLQVADGGLYPPSILEEICKSPKSLEKVKKLKFMMFAGAPLSEASGNILSRVTKLHNTFGSTELGVYPVYLAKGTQWTYFKFHPYFGIKMEPRDERRFELVVHKSSKLHAFQSVFHLYPNRTEYRTSDLFTRHPSNPDLWRYDGRVDDLIILSHGEDLHPIRMESVIRQNPHVKEALIGGYARNKPFVLIELNEPMPTGTRSKDEILEGIWPTILEANLLCSEYVRLIRSLVAFTAPEKPLRRTLKGTIDRRRSLEDYKAELDSLYKEESNSV